MCASSRLRAHHAGRGRRSRAAPGARRASSRSTSCAYMHASESENRVLRNTKRGVAEVDERAGRRARAAPRTPAIGVPWQARLHVAEAVGLDEVAELDVDDQAADDQLRVELEVVDRPARPRRACLAGARRRARSHVLDAVVDQRVVHVVADRLDRAQVERAVAEDAAVRRRPGDHGSGGVHRRPRARGGGPSQA